MADSPKTFIQLMVYLTVTVQVSRFIDNLINKQD